MRFLTRSTEREASADAQRIDPIRRALGGALQSLEAEHEGFKRRIDETTIRAALIAGNDTDNEADREPGDNRLLRDYEEQIRSAETRLTKLQGMISNLKFIRAAVITRLGE